ncbi:MAG TPA: protein kinase [Chroococcidiopsis sp.]
MQPPISAGTVLQNRYRLLSVLGQGGFGRTYLAEDQGRFNERCALKEFIPMQAGAYALEKSKELFQREAATLYQIQHPQIPQFRATFEENERLFLVQDYVDGKTYRDLLNERKLQGRAFSEPEVMQLFRQLLPVLGHIHSKGIIHRDIAPDNIILRQNDNLPVLIDFGVVKEIATRFQFPATLPQQTTVGKLGYAPSEQMQTGRAYPSSDLYALAVTAVVLLTGREPQDMYDDVNLVWHWHQYANVSPNFGNVLNKMLSYRPGDRFQSVNDVLQALQLMTGPPVSQPVPPGKPQMASPPVPGSNISQMQTIAVGRRPEPTAHVARSPRPGTPYVPQPKEQTLWDNPLAVIGICLGLAVITGIGSWAVVSAILNSSQPQPTASATASPSPTASATPTLTPSPTQTVAYEQRLDLVPGESTTAEGNLRANETVTYIVTAKQGEQLTIGLEDEGVLLTVLGPDRKPVDDRAERVPRWQGTLAATGDYYVQISPVRNLPDSDYRVTFGLEPAAEPSPTPTPSPSPTETPSPQIETQRLRFPEGEDSILVSERVAPNLIRRYLVNVSAGQVMEVEAVEGNVRFNIRYPNGDLVQDAGGVEYWQAQLPDSGDFQVDVVADDAVDFTVRIKVTGNPF